MKVFVLCKKGQPNTNEQHIKLCSTGTVVGGAGLCLVRGVSAVIAVRRVGREVADARAVLGAAAARHRTRAPRAPILEHAVHWQVSRFIVISAGSVIHLYNIL